MSSIPYHSWWKKRLNAHVYEFESGTGVFDVSRPQNEEVNDFFESHDKIHVNACEKYGALQYEHDRLVRYQEENVVPEEWSESIQGEVFENYTEKAETLQKRLEEEISSLTRKINHLAPQVFPTISAGEWCQDWIQNITHVQYSSTEHIYDSLRKNAKKVIDYFFVECVSYFDGQAVNLAQMASTLNARLSLLASEIEGAKNLDRK